MNYNNVNPRGLPRPHDGNGRIFHKVDRWYPSSQTCSQCGFNTSNKNSPASIGGEMNCVPTIDNI